MVCLVRTLYNGTITREWMSPLEAVTRALADPQNGVTIVSCHIEGNTHGWDMSYACPKDVEFSQRENYARYH